MNITLQQLAEMTGGRIVSGDAALVLTGFNSILEAIPGDITFLGNPRYISQLARSQAAVVLAGPALTGQPAEMAVIEVENPTLAFQVVVRAFGPKPRSFPPGIHPAAVLGRDLSLDPATVHVGAAAVIEDGARIGAGSVIHAGAFVGAGATLGQDCIVHANAVIKDRSVLGDRVVIHSCAVIGSDGFGYQLKDGRHQKIEQVGIVQIDDDVEVGSCTTIDRARFGRTWIGEGTKIDNLVQIAHNVVIGKHSIVVSQVGISGSSRVGSHTTIAGQVGVAGHLKIGDDITILAKSGITKDLTEPGQYTGYPARPITEGRKILALSTKQPEMFERLRNLEKRLEELERKSESEV